MAKIGQGGTGFDFTKIANDGSVLLAITQLGSGAKDWACTLDNVTGLLWEVKTDDRGLRDQANRYSWYNPDDKRNGGWAGYQNRGVCTGNALKLCGKSDWRLPKRAELLSIVHRGRLDPVIDGSYFPNTVSDRFWSSSPVANVSDGAWIVHFGKGHYSWNGRNANHFVRLVRGGQ